MLGSSGDIWVAASNIYVKEQGVWSKWSGKHQYRYPSDSNYTLTWTRNAELKYLKSPRQEVFLWKSKLMFIFIFVKDEILNPVHSDSGKS